MSSEQTQLINKMIAWRAKYRVSQRKSKYSPGLVVPHHNNRGGDPMAPTRLRELGGTIAFDGYDGIDANTNGVLVQEKPVSSGGTNNIFQIEYSKKIAADRDVAEFGIKGVNASVVFLTAISIASSGMYRQA